MIERMRTYAAETGRDPMSIGLERRVPYSAGPQRWRQAIDEWRGLGGTHVSISTMQAESRTPDAHIDALRTFKTEVG